MGWREVGTHTAVVSALPVVVLVLDLSLCQLFEGVKTTKDYEIPEGPSYWTSQYD